MDFGEGDEDELDTGPPDDAVPISEVDEVCRAAGWKRLSRYRRKELKTLLGNLHRVRPSREELAAVQPIVKAERVAEAARKRTRVYPGNLPYALVLIEDRRDKFGAAWAAASANGPPPDTPSTQPEPISAEHAALMTETYARMGLRWGASAAVEAPS
jgi:hypothetical protein